MGSEYIDIGRPGRRQFTVDTSRVRERRGVAANQPTNQTQTCAVTQRAGIENRADRRLCESQLIEPEHHVNCRRPQRKVKQNERENNGTADQTIKQRTKSKRSLLRAAGTAGATERHNKTKNHKIERRTSDRGAYTEDNELQA